MAASFSEEAEGSVVGTVEQVIDEYNVDFASLPAAVTVNIAALVRVTGGTGTFNVRVGGTIGAADGTVRATISTASLVYVQQQNTGASFANPGGQQLVKITAVNDTAGESSFVRGYNGRIG